MFDKLTLWQQKQIGFPSDKIIGAKLPSGRDVMRFFIKHRENKCTIRESAHTTYDELIKTPRFACLRCAACGHFVSA